MIDVSPLPPASPAIPSSAAPFPASPSLLLSMPELDSGGRKRGRAESQPCPHTEKRLEVPLRWGVSTALSGQLWGPGGDQ